MRILAPTFAPTKYRALGQMPRTPARFWICFSIQRVFFQICIIYHTKAHQKPYERSVYRTYVCFAYVMIKKIVINGREITEVLSPLKTLVTVEEELRARGICKKNGLFSKVMGKAVDDFDEFLALEQMA